MTLNLTKRYMEKINLVVIRLLWVKRRLSMTLNKVTTQDSRVRKELNLMVYKEQPQLCYQHLNSKKLAVLGVKDQSKSWVRFLLLLYLKSTWLLMCQSLHQLKSLKYLIKRTPELITLRRSIQTLKPIPKAITQLIKGRKRIAKLD